MAETGSKIFDLDALTDIADDDVLVEVDVSDTTDSADGTNKKITVRDLLNKLKDGWDPIETTCVYSSADDPTFAFTITGDQTGILGVGMKLKLTQTTDKYFIITAISYSDPTTTVTVYGGTDYDLANATITDPFFSTRKAPLGFPLSPVKWTVETKTSADGDQATPTNSTWYNIGASITIPRGCWDVRYKGCLAATNSAVGYLLIDSTLSTGASTETDDEFGDTNYLNVVDLSVHQFMVSARNIINIATEDVYYLNARVATDGTCSKLSFEGGTRRPTIIRAVCAYL